MVQVKPTNLLLGNDDVLALPDSLPCCLSTCWQTQDLAGLGGGGGHDRLPSSPSLCGDQLDDGRSLASNTSLALY